MIIIGAGSAGLFLAIKRAEHNLANKKNEKIIVVEEHKTLGLPVQCTGILTDDIYSLIEKKEIEKFIINKINKTKIYSENNSVELVLNDNIIIDNRKFIDFLAAKAKAHGVQILAEHKYLSNEGNKIKIKDLKTGKTKTFQDNFLVGADGPLSKVASCNNLCKNKKYLLGIQARVKTTKKNKNIIDFYPGVGAYAWSVPEGGGNNSDHMPENENTSRVGVAVPLNKQSEKNKIFEEFLKKYPGSKIEMQAGIIPLYAPGKKIIKIKKTKNNHKPKEKFSVALVGDAALQIKNTTGGGIIPGMKAADALSKGAENYKKNLRKLNRELYLHYLLHRAFSKYKSRDWDRLIKKAEDKKIKKILEKNNRDNTAKIILALAVNPKMIGEGIRVLGKIVK
ncbi:MAG: FAD-dependent monooxygenase [Candidatus Nanoarchaeia archaeon]